MKRNPLEENILPKGTTPEEAISILTKYFIPENEILCEYPARRNQAITEIISYIMTHYESAKYKQYPWYKKIMIHFNCLFNNHSIYNYY